VLRFRRIQAISETTLSQREKDMRPVAKRTKNNKLIVDNDRYPTIALLTRLSSKSCVMLMQSFLETSCAFGRVQNIIHKRDTWVSVLKSQLRFGANQALGEEGPDSADDGEHNGYDHDSGDEYPFSNGELVAEKLEVKGEGQTKRC